MRINQNDFLFGIIDFLYAHIHNEFIGKTEDEKDVSNRLLWLQYS